MSVQDFVRNYALTCYTFDGVEEDYFIAKLIYRYMEGKRVLDLGCGSVVPITSIFYPEAEEVVAVDRLKANLDFVRNNTVELQEIIDRAVKYRKGYLSQKLVRPKIKLVKGDVTDKLDIGKFDSVMALGCLGTLNTAEEYQKAVSHVYEYLKTGGTFLVISWIGTADRPYRFNGAVRDEEILEPTLREVGFQIKEIHMSRRVVSEDTKQLGYTGIIWAALDLILKLEDALVMAAANARPFTRATIHTRLFPEPVYRRTYHRPKWKWALKFKVSALQVWETIRHPAENPQVIPDPRGWIVVLRYRKEGRFGQVVQPFDLYGP